VKKMASSRVSSVPRYSAAMESPGSGVGPVESPAAHPGVKHRAALLVRAYPKRVMSRALSCSSIDRSSS
jgi:hypothetical protein